MFVLVELLLAFCQARLGCLQLLFEEFGLLVQLVDYGVESLNLGG